MKFIKRLFKFAVVMLLLAVLLAVVVVVRSRQQPEWYAQVQTIDPAAREQAAQGAQRKFESTWNWVSAREAADRRAAIGDTRPPLSPVPDPVFTVTFSEQELNGFFQRWKEQNNWDRLYEQYVTNPAIVLHEGKVILAGTVKVKEVDSVVSFHFRPALDAGSGKLRLDLESVMAGKLPMPQALFEQYRKQLGAELAMELPQYQESARMLSDGSVNDAALQAAVGELMVSILNRGSVDPVLLMTGNLALGGSARLVPVRLVGAKIEGSSVTLSVEMMTTEQRQAWLQRLRGPFGKPIAPAN